MNKQAIAPNMRMQGERPWCRLLTGGLLVAGLAGCKASTDEGAITANGSLEVLPSTEFSASGERGGPFADSTVYTLGNSGDAPLFWSVQPSAAWLSLSSTAGTLAPGASEVLTVSVDAGFASGLDAGEHSAALVFRDLGRGLTVAVIAASLEVLPLDPGAGALTASPSQFTAGGPKGGPFASPSQTVTLQNPGTGPILWTATGDVPWIGVTPSSGMLSAGAQQQVSVTLRAAASSLGTGSHDGKAVFTDAVGASTLVEVDVSLGIGTTIENQAWLNVHGQPFFPIGVWNQPPWEGQVLYLKGLGINTYLNNGLTPPEPTNGQLMDLLEAHDMWAILHFDDAVKTHPRLLGWLLGDEPDLSSKPVSLVQAEYDAVRAADADHFVGLNLTGGFYWDSNFGNPSVESQYQGYLAIPDIASFDMYPVTGWNQSGWLYMPGAMTQFLLERYVQRQKPAWAIIEASDQRLSWTPPGTPGPTASQMRFEVWDAIIHGATAIHYFTIAFDPFEWTNLTPTIEQELTRTNGQITALTDVILSPAPASTVTSAEASGRKHNLMLRRKGDVFYLFADNADMGYRSETITFQASAPISSVTVWSEGRTITPSGNTFTDAFAPLEVHIYEIRF